MTSNDDASLKSVPELMNCPQCFVILDFHNLLPSSLPAHQDVLQTGDSKRLPKLYLSSNADLVDGNSRSFRTDSAIHYEGFCDDFGPMSMLSIMEFVSILDQELHSCKDDGIAHLVYVAGDGRRDFTNAAFLLGAYLILKLDQAPQDVDNRFKLLHPMHFEGYRNATFSPPDFRLQLIDCWEGLYRGKSLGWVTLPTADCNSQWGQIDQDAYAHYNDPLNGDLHEVVPKKFVAFRGPKHLQGSLYKNNYEKRSREFDPKYYVDIFEDLEVSTVVRLNETTYPSQTFEDAGIDHYDLCFDDCTPPPPAVVQRFIEIVDKAKGAVAVHCKAGLGRTGTLIALYMMRSYGFSAREAMGWLRIMRPGSVIGEQQRFLCTVDAEMRSRAAAGRLPRSAVAAKAWALRASVMPHHPGLRRSTSPGQAAEHAAQVSSGVSRRDQARAMWARPGKSATMMDLRSAKHP